MHFFDCICIVTFIDAYAVAGIPKSSKGDKKSDEVVSQEEADAFNAAQRGHQNPLEVISDFHVMSLISKIIGV